MKNREVLTDVAATVLEILGILAVSYGAGQAYAPLGWCLAGVFLIVIGFSLSPKSAGPQDRGPESR